MAGFVDIHSHILPGVDDGAKSVEQSMNMVRIAYQEGIREIIATPHFCIGRFENDVALLKERWKALKKETARAFPDMKLYLGNEVMYSADVDERIEDGTILSLADSMYVLVEFYPFVEKREIEEGMHRVVLSGKTPILAHVERYQALLGEIDAIYALRDIGAYIQVNSGSVTGKLGRTVQKQIKALMKEDLVDFVATDCHSDGHRAPYIRECAKYLEKKFGREYMEMLLVANPRHIIQNEYL